MIKLTDEQREFIVQNLPSGEKLVKAKDVDDILGPLDDWITANGFDDKDELTDEGRRIQRMYDNIYNNN